MGEWKECKLGDLAEIVKEKYTPKKGDKLNYIGLEHIQEQTLRLIGIGNSDDISSDKFYFKNGDILFGRLRPYFRKVVRPKFDGVCSTDIWVIRSKNNVLQEYLFYLFANKELIDLSDSGEAGTRMPRADWDFLSQSVWNIPLCKNEQRAIASVLSSLDDKIDLLHRQNKTLEAMAETLFRQWFVEEADDGWEERPLSEILTITSSKRIFYSEYVTSGVPFYRSKEIIELRKTGSTNCELFISEDRFNEIDKKFGSPKTGDILMTSVGTLGIPYRVKKGDRFYFKDGNLTWFKDFREIPSSIIYFWLLSKIGQEELASITIGSTQEALTIDGLKSITFKVPPKEKIANYEHVFNILIEKIEFNQSQINTLEKLRDILLPKLMSGEIRVEL